MTTTNTIVRTRKQAPKLDEKTTKALASQATVSGKIRYLDSQGYERADIARILGKLYQHVKNVLDKPLKAQG